MPKRPKRDDATLAAARLAEGAPYGWTAQWEDATGRRSNTSDRAWFDVAIVSDAGWRGTVKEEDQPLGPLFVRILQRLGVETDSFAGCTGTLNRM